MLEWIIDAVHRANEKEKSDAMEVVEDEQPPTQLKLEDVANGGGIRYAGPQSKRIWRWDGDLQSYQYTERGGEGGPQALTRHWRVHDALVSITIL